METYDPHKTVPEVRQGNRRRMNLRVLVISLIGIVVAFSILLLSRRPFNLAARVL